MLTVCNIFYLTLCGFVEQTTRDNTNINNAIYGEGRG